MSERSEMFKAENRIALKEWRKVMGEYIKKEDAIEAIESGESTDGIRALVTEDVVEVVRCKDCKGYAPADETYGTCYAYKGVYGKIKPTDYCSYGEREDNE